MLSLEGRSVCGSVCGWRMVSEWSGRNLGRVGVGLKILLWKVLTFVYSYIYWESPTLPSGPMRKKRSESLIGKACLATRIKDLFADSWGRVFGRSWISQLNCRLFLVSWWTEVCQLKVLYLCPGGWKLKRNTLRSKLFLEHSRAFPATCNTRGVCSGAIKAGPFHVTSCYLLRCRLFCYIQGGWLWMGGNSTRFHIKQLHSLWRNTVFILLSTWQPVLVKMPAGHGPVPTGIRSSKSSQSGLLSVRSVCAVC